MSVTVTCPSCRNKYATHEKHAGKLVACKQCGQSMKIPQPDAASRAAWQIPFTCERCGKTYVLSSNLAGKKMVCTKCGLKSRIPAGELGISVASDSVGTLKPAVDPPGTGHRTIKHDNPSGRHTLSPRAEPPATNPSIPVAPQASVVDWDSDPELEPLTIENPLFAPIPVAKPVEPKAAPVPKVDEKPKAAVRPEIDLYGLNDPVPPLVPAGVDPTSPLNGNPVLGESTDAHPRRLGDYKPTQNRSDRVEKTQPYGKTVFGVSFSTILAIALFGYRMYRRTTIYEPDAGQSQVSVSAPNEPGKEGWLAAEADRQYALKIAQPSTVEAREWLDTTKYPDHGVRGGTMDRARDLVNHFYQNGAVGVYAINPTKEGDTVLAEIIVQLPDDPNLRWKCLEGGASGPNDGTRHPLDFGNKYVTLFGKR